jgi:hypothetical protein
MALRDIMLLAASPAKDRHPSAKVFLVKACFILGGLLLLVGGCSVAGSYATRDRLARVPRMTCDQLARNGPPADGQVTLTDVRPCNRGFVALPSGEFDHTVFLPAYASGLGQEPEPPKLGFLLQIYGDHGRYPLLEQPGPVEVTCWAKKGASVVEIGHGPAEIEKAVQKALQEKYPGIRLNDVWVLTVGHGLTPTAERVRSAWQWGIVELLIGAAVLVAGGILARRQLGSLTPHNNNGLAECEEGRTRYCS